jgi:hypothetical protein
MVVAPYILSAGKIEPYVSLTELKFSATAAAVDFTNLVENAGLTGQDRSLYELIVRASSKIDTFCMGQYGTLNATTNNDGGRYRLDRKGRFKIAPPFKPVIEVTAFSWGAIMGGLASVPITVNNCWIEREHIIIQAYGASQVNSYAGMQAFSYVVGPPYDGEYYCNWTYVNGWANSFTTSTTESGATSIDLLDVTGLQPGQNEMIWDGLNDEYIQVSPAWVPGNLTVDLVNPTLYKHGSGVNVSTIPPVVKQACIHFVVAMVKQRGQGGIVLNEMGAETMVAGKSEMSAEDELRGYDLLDEFKSQWGRQ